MLNSVKSFFENSLDTDPLVSVEPTDQGPYYSLCLKIHAYNRNPASSFDRNQGEVHYMKYTA